MTTNDEKPTGGDPTPGARATSGGPIVRATHVRGQGGEHLFGYLLSKLGFGEAANLRDDMGNGIDSFVFVRRPVDETRAKFVELGVIAAQVKTGDSWFESPTDGGWWHRVDKEDRHNWLAQHLAHIVVLIDDSADTAYWAELNPTSLISTGEHYKVLVPESQTISVEDEEQLRDVLLRSQVRLSGYRSTSWIRPGEQWHDQGDELVAAMLTPRMVAPHPNIIRLPDAGPVTPTQAIALVCGGRVAELEANLEVSGAEHADLASFADNADWRWRLAAALHHLEDSGDAFAQLIETADTEIERTAAAVALACCVARRGGIDAARRACVDHRPDRGSFQRGWTLVQEARFARLDGERDLPLELLNEAIQDLAIDQRPWPAAVLAAARVAQINLGQIDAHSTQVVVEAADNPATWWTAQARAQVLDAHLEDAMGQFSPPGSFRAVFEDVAPNREAGLVLAADLAGDHGRFLHDQRLAGRRIALTAPNSPKHLEVAIGLLRASGDATAVSHLSRRLLKIGAYETLARMWRDPTDPNLWRRPSTLATANLVRAQLTAIPQAEVDAFAQALQRVFAVEHRFNGLDHHTVVDLAVSTLGLASHEQMLALFDAMFEGAVAALDAHPDHDDAQRSIARLVERLSLAALGERVESVREIMERPLSQAYRRSLAESLLAVDSHDGYRVLAELAAEGDVQAVEVLAVRGRPPENAAAVLIEGIARAVARAEAFARPGDPHLFTVAVRHAVSTDDEALWTAILDAVSNQRVGGDEKAEILASMLRSAGVPDSIRQRLGTRLEEVAVDGATWDETEDLPTSEALTLVATVVAGPEDGRGLAAERLICSRSPLDRVLGILLLTQPAAAYSHHLAARRLRPLTDDPHPHVATIAARAMAELVIADRATASDFVDLTREYSPSALRDSVARLTASDSPNATVVLDSLRNHGDPHIQRLIAGRRA